MQSTQVTTCSGQAALDVASAFGSRKKLVQGLKQDLHDMHKKRGRGTRSGLTRLQMERVLEALKPTGKDRANEQHGGANLQQVVWPSFGTGSGCKVRILPTWATSEGKRAGCSQLFLVEVVILFLWFVGKIICSIQHTILPRTQLL